MYSIISGHQTSAKILSLTFGPFIKCKNNNTISSNIVVTAISYTYTLGTPITTIA